MDEAMTVQAVDDLYVRYGKSLEAQHKGEYAAIAQDGRVITGTDDLQIAQRAVQEFGSGNFVLYRVGYDYVHKLK